MRASCSPCATDARRIAVARSATEAYVVALTSVVLIALLEEFARQGRHRAHSATDRSRFVLPTIIHPNDAIRAPTSRPRFTLVFTPAPAPSRQPVLAPASLTGATGGTRSDP